MENILPLIFSYLDISDWFNTKLVCRQWRRIGNKIFDPSQVDFPFQAKNLLAIKFLLNDGRADPSIEDNYAIKKTQDVEVMKLLLQDPRVNPNVEEDSPFISAIGDGNIEMVKLLFPRINLDNSDLDLAIESRNLEIIKFLYESGVKGNSPLIEAADTGNVDIIKFFVEKGEKEHAIHHTIINNHSKATHYLLDQGFCPFRESILIAACYGHLGLIKSLIDDPRVNQEFILTSSILGYAIHYRDYELFNMLLERGCDPSDNNNFALRKALEIGHHQFAKILAEKYLQKFIT